MNWNFYKKICADISHSYRRICAKLCYIPSTFDEVMLIWTEITPHFVACKFCACVIECSAREMLPTSRSDGPISPWLPLLEVRYSFLSDTALPEKWGSSGLGDLSTGEIPSHVCRDPAVTGSCLLGASPCWNQVNSGPVWRTVCSTDRLPVLEPPRPRDPIYRPTGTSGGTSS